MNAVDLFAVAGGWSHGWRMGAAVPRCRRPGVREAARHRVRVTRQQGRRPVRMAGGSSGAGVPRRWQVTTSQQRDPEEWIGLVLVAGCVIGALMWWGFALAKEMR